MSGAGQTLSLSLFGAFRQFADDSVVALKVPDGGRVADLRSALEHHYADNANALALLEASAFATDTAILNESDPLTAGEALSVLPPVCGG
jgi:molybdopterin converting factor small subunit